MLRVDRASLGGEAVGAGAVQHDLVTGNREARLRLEAVNRALETRVAERLHLAALVTDEVVVMVVRNGLEAGDSGAEVDPLYETLGAQRVEDAIDAREPDRLSAAAQLVVDLLGGQAAILRAEQVDHGPLRAAVSTAGGS